MKEMECKERVKCVIFDFNGTLFFDYNENKDAWNIIARKYRGKEFGEEGYRSVKGKTDRRCAEYIVKDATDEILDQISEEKEEIYLRLLVERNIQLEEYALSFIKKCKERNVRVMIASSAPKMNMDWYIRNLKLDHYFNIDDIVAGRNDIPSKPAPDIYIYTQGLGGFKGEECIAFEDAPGGLKSALGAGFRRVYGIKSPGMDLEETGKLAPLLDWKWANDHIDEILG